MLAARVLTLLVAVRRLTILVSCALALVIRATYIVGPALRCGLRRSMLSCCAILRRGCCCRVLRGRRLAGCCCVGIGVGGIAGCAASMAFWWWCGCEHKLPRRVVFAVSIALRRPGWSLIVVVAKVRWMHRVPCRLEHRMTDGGVQTRLYIVAFNSERWLSLFSMRFRLISLVRDVDSGLVVD